VTGKEREKIHYLLLTKDHQGQTNILLEDENYSIKQNFRNFIVSNSDSGSRQPTILFRIIIRESQTRIFRRKNENLSGLSNTKKLFFNQKQSLSDDIKKNETIENPQICTKYYSFSNLNDLETSTTNKTKKSSDLNAQTTQDDASIELKSYNFTMALVPPKSLLETIPNPILEIDFHGTIIYFNRAAAKKFPTLEKLGSTHPLIIGIVDSLEAKQQKDFIREIQIESEYFEESICFLPQSKSVRIFVVDISDRKLNEFAKQEAEEKYRRIYTKIEEQLQKRDRLLQAVAEAARCLLAEIDYEKALELAFSGLGRAAEIDRIYLLENHPHSRTGAIATSLRYVWARDPAPSAIDLSRWRERCYSEFDRANWYQTLCEGRSVSLHVKELPIAERTLLSLGKVRSLLVVPIFLAGKFWGCLGFADCQQERHWSVHEESTLFAMAASISSALQRQQTEALILHRSLHDLLTELPNRTLFHEQLSLSIANASRQEKSLAILFLDLDRFKTIDETLGHTIGDRLLVSVAQRLKKALRSGDIVARWGGDEFTILLSQVSQTEDVAIAAQRILQVLDSVFIIGDRELYITSSIGIAMLNEESGDAETLIKNADTALYYAKQRGRNQYQFYHSSMSVKVPERLTLEKYLRQALKKQEFSLFYQPRVEVTTGNITGVEALLRWQSAHKGFVSPNVFIPIAEESGAIVSIGEWVLHMACRQNKVWQDAGLPPICMAVNLSPQQFHQPHLVETVAKILQQTGLAPQYLELEITETMAIQDIELTRNILQKLEKMGVRLAIDDFGTGHSSLSRLQLLPLHNLKIDRSFISNLTTDNKVSHIVTAIVTLGRSLGLSIIAEGVEKQEELDFLRSIDCESVQGYLFYRPLSAEAITGVLCQTSEQKFKSSKFKVQSSKS
jgi:diguanylate cyclase (GGDEF)-like protein